MQMMINGMELEGDVLDADFMERLHDAMNKMACSAKKAAAGELSAPEQIRAQCRMVFECFNDVFGEGTDQRLFGARCNLGQAMRAFGELAKALQRQQEEAVALLSAYLPDAR